MRSKKMAVKITEDCVGCGACVDTCPSGALELGDEGLAVVDADNCVDCGACIDTCPSEAIVEG